VMYRCSLIPYAVCSALRTEHVRSLRIGISLKMAKYLLRNTCEVHFAVHLRSNGTHVSFEVLQQANVTHSVEWLS